ncbi:divisome protein SepX/GlpR [Jiangella alkaliphila]|uniref:Uncharacterized protein n=1 Tax=Jiangella alkaliphila TaxID=419479 RepID=A0A1H2IW87_9ACTN|nr:hypothetical protein [Jiangella alkaliphila]SDU48078.1 hypothetical protein SAMN04488563_2045 [Jiangella alkaliphila]
MGYSGLIYAAIVAAWAAFLVPKWVRRNEEVEHARETDMERRVRVLSRRAGPPQAPHGVVTVPATSGAPAVSSPAARPAEPDVFAVAAQRRRRMLSLLLVLLIVSVALVVMGRAPAWAPAGPGVLLFLFLFVARRAAVLQARRRRVEARRRASSRQREARQAAVVWASDTESSEAEEGTPRRLVLPDELVAEAPVEDPNAWSPVSVPLPTYLTKAKATRPAARKIDLGQPGAWTSGRLDPASSIELPRRDPAERPAASSEPVDATDAEDVVEERRRAVGD